MEEIKVVQKSGSIEANFEEVKANLNSQLEIYRKMVFTEDSKKVAKDTVAELRKGKKELADRCKEVKNEWMIPLNNFMAQAEELSKMFDEPICYINDQIDAFEQKRIAEKKQVIANIYAELVPEEEWANIIPLNKIYNPKWENATFTEKQIKDEVMTRKSDAKNAISTITSMHSEMEAKAIEMYKLNFNMTEAILFLNNYEAQKKEIMERERERMRREEEERIRAEERRKIFEEQQKAEEMARAVEEAKAEAKEEAKAEVVEQFIPTDVEAEEQAWQYTMMLTPEAKEKVEIFLNSVGIEFFVMGVDE